MNTLRNIFLSAALILTPTPLMAQEQNAPFDFISDEDFKKYCNTPEQPEYYVTQKEEPSNKPLNFYACRESKLWHVSCQDITEQIAGMPALIEEFKKIEIFDHTDIVNNAMQVQNFLEDTHQEYCQPSISWNIPLLIKNYG